MFFNKHASKYMEESFTKNTKYEVDFIEEELNLKKGSLILDVGCGTGRHSVELAKRGYRVIGVDISENMLNEAKKACQRERVSVEFVHADAVEFKIKEPCDACICLCEGAFGLLSMEEDPFERDLRILQNVNTSLKKGSKFILTALNGLRMIRMYTDEDVKAGRFDHLTITEIHTLADLLPDAPEEVLVKEKGFVASELVQLLKMAGFSVKHIWGGTAGMWKREPLRMDEMELMVVSTKVQDCF